LNVKTVFYYNFSWLVKMNSYSLFALRS